MFRKMWNMEMNFSILYHDRSHFVSVREILTLAAETYVSAEPRLGLWRQENHVFLFLLIPISVVKDRLHFSDHELIIQLLVLWITPQSDPEIPLLKASLKKIAANSRSYSHDSIRLKKTWSSEQNGNGKSIDKIKSIGLWKQVLQRC